jgi:NADPH:quinone reductase-like Zn-dependent oxidoreductase
VHAFTSGGPGRLKQVLIACAGKVRPVVDSTFELDDALQAYERLMTNRARGKVIVSIDKNA